MPFLDKPRKSLVRGKATIINLSIKANILAPRKVTIKPTGSPWRTLKEAIDFLFRRPPFQDAKEPDIVLLDINLPLKSGIEVLQEVKSDDRVKHIPVIMLTTSSSEKDISLSYKHHANCYITKPVEVSKFLEAVNAIEHFWLQIVSLDGKN